MNSNTEAERLSSLSMGMGIALLIFVLLFNVLFGSTLFITPFLTFLPVAARTVIGYTLDTVFYLASFMIPAFCFRAYCKKKKHPVRPMMRPLRLPKETPLIVVAGVGVTLAFAVVNSWLVGWIGIGSDTPVEPGAGWYEYFLMFIYTAMAPAFCEEFLFRGTFLNELMPYGKTAAVFTSAFLFAMMHQNIAQLLYTFVAGIVMATVYIETRSIFTTTLIHLFNNLMAVVDEILVAEMEEATAYALIAVMDTVLITAGVICGLILLKKRKEKKTAEEEERREGYFGREWDNEGGGALCPLSPRQKVRALASPALIAFTVISVITMVISIFLL